MCLGVQYVLESLAFLLMVLSGLSEVFQKVLGACEARAVPEKCTMLVQGRFLASSLWCPRRGHCGACERIASFPL
jgi:hypothetical protein